MRIEKNAERTGYLYILLTFFTIRQFMLCSFRIRFWMSWARYYKTWFVVCRCQEYVWLILSSVSEILVGNTTKLLLQKRLKNSWKYYVNRKMFLLVFVEKKSLTSLIFFIFVTYSKWLLFQVSRLIDYGSHPSLLRTFGLNATSPYDSYLSLIFGKFALIWGHFQNVSVCSFRGRWDPKWRKF